MKWILVDTLTRNITSDIFYIINNVIFWRSDMKNLIKKIRFYLNMSQTEFAEHMNVSFATVNRWENGRAVPNKLAQMRLHELCKHGQFRFMI